VRVHVSARAPWHWRPILRRSPAAAASRYRVTVATWLRFEVIAYEDRWRRSDALMWFYCGRDVVAREGWLVSIKLLPTPSVMRASEQGRETLAALSWRCRVWRPFGWRWRGQPPWPHVRFHWSSDAREIAERLAAVGWMR